MIETKTKTSEDVLADEKGSTCPDCPCCGTSSVLLVKSMDSNRHTTDLTFTYYRCDGCGLVFMHPIPQDMHPFYKGGYQEIPSSLDELRSLASKEKYRMAPILRHKTEGKLLEIGPWIGMFSCNAKDAGFDVTAMDMDERCLQFLSNTVGIRTFQSNDPAETLASMTERFDVIALWHCLEHLPEPWLVIERAAEKLAPGGVLLIAIPNIESYEFSAFKSAWRHLDTPRHLYFYSSDSLVDLCRRNGLKKLEVTTKDELSIALSQDFWSHWAALKTSSVFFAKVLARLGFYFGQFRQRNTEDAGSGITAVFQRPLNL
jgi:SAM-dependent methyltransferase